MGLLEICSMMRREVLFRRCQRARVEGSASDRRGSEAVALEHETFVTMALEELILFGVVRDLGSAHDPNTRVPTVVAPLNVVPKKAGKLRLCHDGRPANKSIC